MPDVCPAWCVIEHAEVGLLTPGTDDGRTGHTRAKALEPRGGGVALSAHEARSLAAALPVLADAVEALA